jgi:hypothetical protein
MFALAGILREQFGPLPFRPNQLDPGWLAWDAGTVRRLAETLSAEGRFDHLGVLADALEDAGCADADVLGHLRAEGMHPRGCWVVDAILGKN